MSPSDSSAAPRMARGQRLSRLVAENLDEAAILARLDPLLARFAVEAEATEGFGDFLTRRGLVEAVPNRDIPLERVA